MTTLTQLQADLTARFLKVLPPVMLSKQGATRPVYRFIVVVDDAGTLREGQVDVSVFDPGTPAETAVVFNNTADKQVPVTIFRDAVDAWIAANAPAGLVKYVIDEVDEVKKFARVRGFVADKAIVGAFVEQRFLVYDDRGVIKFGGLTAL